MINIELTELEARTLVKILGHSFFMTAIVGEDSPDQVIVYAIRLKTEGAYNKFLKENPVPF